MFQGLEPTVPNKINLLSRVACGTGRSVAEAGAFAAGDAAPGRGPRP